MEYQSSIGLYFNLSFNDINGIPLEYQVITMVADGWKIVSIYVPETLSWDNQRLRQFIVELTDYMGIPEERMGDYLVNHPDLELMYDQFDQVLPQIKQKMTERMKRDGKITKTKH